MALIIGESGSGTSEYSDRERHFVGEVDYHLLCDDKPYEGAKSHREALRSAFEWLVEESIEDKESYRSMFGDDLADRILPLVYDIDKAQFSPLDPQFFSTVRIL